MNMDLFASTLKFIIVIGFLALVGVFLFEVMVQ